MMGKLITICIFLALLTLITGCSNNYTVTVIFDNVEGLGSNAKVSVNGMEVGEVEDMALVKEGVAVTIAIDKKHVITKFSVFELRKAGLIGYSDIEILPAVGKEILRNGDTIKGESYNGQEVQLTGEMLDSLATTFAKALKE